MASRTRTDAARAALTASLLAVLVGCSTGHRAATKPTTAATTTAAPTSAPGPSSSRPTTSRPATSAPATSVVPTLPPTTGGLPPTTPPPDTTPPTVPPTGPAVAIRRGPTTKRVVALTFDAGSDAGYAKEILDLLDAQHVRASFGVTGVWAEANASLVRRMAATGQILNHTYDHRSFTGVSTRTAPLTASERRSELTRGAAAIRAAGGPPTAPFFRPPYGDDDASVRVDVAAAGYHDEVLWTVDSLGWNGLSADAIVSRCLDPAVVGPGVIYLFHVGSQSADHAAVARIIAGLRSRGYSFVTVAGLLAG